MIRRKNIVFILLLGILILTTDALALPVGTHFGFYDNVVSPGTNPWIHDLNNLDNNDFFFPPLDGSEPNLIIKHALLMLSINFTPNAIGKFKASVELDGKSLGIINYHFKNNLVKNRLWWKSINDLEILNSISIDRLASIGIITSPGWGTLNHVHHSVLLGSGQVGPEPISMALVGAGLAGLPIAVRFRRLLRK